MLNNIVMYVLISYSRWVKKYAEILKFAYVYDSSSSGTVRPVEICIQQQIKLESLELMDMSQWVVKNLAVKLCMCPQFKYAVTGNKEEWEKAVSEITTSMVSVKKKKDLL